MSHILDRYRLFLVDMDDTLYEERDFVLSGFRAVAEHAASWGIDPALSFEFLRDRFDSTGREQIFDHWLTHFKGQSDPTRIRDLVEIYRTHTPIISLYPGVEKVLNSMQARGRVVVVTDGLPEVQARKFGALGLAGLVDEVVYCWATGFPKPDVRSLQGIVEQEAIDAVMIGDNPCHDMAMAENLSISAIRVRTGRFRSQNSMQKKFEIEKFSLLA